MTTEEGEKIYAARLLDQFQNHCETLNGLIFQTRDDWLGKKSGKSPTSKWASKDALLFDDDAGFKVPHWKLIPYINQEIAEDLAENIALARELKASLEKNFDANQFDISFSKSWGLFCWQVGRLDALLSARPEIRATERTKTSEHVQLNLKGQTLWFSKIYLEFRRDRKLKNRKLIEEAIVETINYCIKNDVGNENGFGRNWFRMLLGDRKNERDHYLSTAFTDKKLSIKKVEFNARFPADNIPAFTGLQRLKTH